MFQRCIQGVSRVFKCDPRVFLRYFNCITYIFLLSFLGVSDRPQKDFRVCLLGQSFAVMFLDYYKNATSTGSKRIWLDFMRMHIGLIECHFLLRVLSITEARKTNIWT